MAGNTHQDGLFDGADETPERVEYVGDLRTAARQFVNRWVFLPHQRPAALLELEELIAEAKKAS